MNIIQTKYGDFDLTHYPLLVYKMGTHNPSLEDIRDTLDKLNNAINSRQGPFVFLMDSSNVSWVNTASRELLTIGIQHIIREKPDRFTANIIYANRFALRILLKITIYFIPPILKLHVFSDLRRARKKAIEIARNF